MAEEAYLVLEVLAQSEGLSPSDFISLLVKQNAKERGFLKKIERIYH